MGYLQQLSSRKQLISKQSEEIVKVLHPPRDVIPLGPVGDPLPEVIPLADVAPVQRAVVVSVGVGQLLEQGVIRSSGDSARHHVT